MQNEQMHNRSLDDIIAELNEISARIDAATYKQLELIRELDEAANWNDLGCKSCAHFLSFSIGLDLGTAREKVRVAHALKQLPKISESLRRGQISYSKVRAATRIATPETEEDLLNVAECGTASHMEKVVRLYRGATKDEDLRKDQEQIQKRELCYFYDEDGMLVLQARLTAEQGAAFCKAIDACEAQLFAKDSKAKVEREQAADLQATPLVTAGERRADALAAVCEAALADGIDSPADSPRMQVVVHVDAEALPEDGPIGRSEMEDGENISAETSRRLCCDAKLLPMIHGKGGQLDVGRASRSISPALKKALKQRDGGCRFPGCECTRFVHGHHLQHWADGGPTNLDNTLLLCSFHHRLVHEGGFRVHKEKDGKLNFQSPDGKPVFEAWKYEYEIGDPLEGLRSIQRHEDFRIDSQTSVPNWDGERLDYAWVVGDLVDANGAREPV